MMTRISSTGIDTQSPNVRPVLHRVLTRLVSAAMPPAAGNYGRPRTQSRPADGCRAVGIRPGRRGVFRPDAAIP
jgi:hypothetical protein